MWDSSAGVRKLQGKERTLFIEGLLSLHDHLRLDEEDDGLPLDIPAFDDIPLTDRLSVLVFVADQVLGDGPPPKGYAWNEAAIGAIFAHLEVMIELEIEAADLPAEPGEDRSFWRRLVHEAWMERCFPASEVKWGKGEGNKQQLSSRDRDHWFFKSECLRSELLEDDDYTMDHFMDAPPDQVAGAKDFLGIPEEYFTQAPPVFPDAERARLDHVLRALQSEGNSA